MIPSPSAPAGSASELSPLERFLRIFAEVRPGEGRIVVTMFANVLLILCAYYFIKPLREGWLSISGIEGLTKMEVKAYSSFGQALLLVWVVSAYGRLVARWPRHVLVSRVTVFCMSNVVIFWCLQPDLFFRSLPHSGVVFYLWVGIFGVFVVAQFWAFAADLFSDERGRRLMPVIAIGATSGAVVGSWIASSLVASELVGSEYLLLVALAPLAGSVWLARIAHAREGVLEKVLPDPPGGSPLAPDAGSLRLVLGSRIILAVAVVTLLTNWVNTNGENLLFRVVQDFIQAEIQTLGIEGESEVLAFTRNATTAFYGGFFFWVNVVALGLQGLVASRLLKYGGFGAIYLMLPTIALISYAAMALVPVLWVIRAMKVAENATDYSINNTARHVLWLPYPASVTYRAKPTIDSLFARLGDGLAAATVLVGVQLVGLSLTGYFVLNVSLVIMWIALALWVVVAHAEMRGRAVAVGA